MCQVIAGPDREAPDMEYPRPTMTLDDFLASDAGVEHRADACVGRGDRFRSKKTFEETTDDFASRDAERTNALAPATSDCPERAFLLSLSFVRAINGPRLQA
jgi:hypothetical protein